LIYLKFSSPRLSTFSYRNSR